MMRVYVYKTEDCLPDRWNGRRLAQQQDAYRERKWSSELILGKIRLRASSRSPRVLDGKHGRKVCLPHTSYPFHHHVPRSPVVYSRYDSPGKNLENCNFTTIDRDVYFTFRADLNASLMYGYRYLTIASSLWIWLRPKDLTNLAEKKMQLSTA